jgi:hypothetical protein
MAVIRRPCGTALWIRVGVNVALGYWNEKRYDDAERELRPSSAGPPMPAPS